jgi:hypothetical protein
MLVRLRRQVKMLEVPVPRERERERMWGPRWEEVVKVWRYLGRWVPVPYDWYLGMVLRVLGEVAAGGCGDAGGWRCRRMRWTTGSSSGWRRFWRRVTI